MDLKFYLNKFIDNFYFSRETEETFNNCKNNALKLATDSQKKLLNRLNSINTKLKDCEERDKYRLYGELITSNLYKLTNTHTDYIELENYYDNNNLIKIPLNKKYSPNINAKHYFKKYNKLKNALQIVSVQKAETENELNNMESATLEEVLIPGEDEEDVETFRERYFASFNNEAFGGNKTDYIEKVNSIDGIGGCKPIRAWSGGYNPAKMMPTDEVKVWFGKQSKDALGETVYNWLSAIYNASINKMLTVGGTVKLVIINSEFRKPSSTLINKVQEEIDPTDTAGEGDGIAPIGHVVNVVGVKEEPINITLSSVEYEAGYSFDKLKEAIETTIDNYLLDLRQTWASNTNLIVRTSQMEAQLLLIDGVLDMKAVLLNDQGENVTLDSDSIPVRGEVVG